MNLSIRLTNFNYFFFLSFMGWGGVRNNVSKQKGPNVPSFGLNEKKKKEESP
jgi:hypothetical protein